jgi:hypothetical protein
MADKEEIYHKMKMNETRQWLTKEASIKTKNTSKKENKRR